MTLTKKRLLHTDAVVKRDLYKFQAETNKSTIETMMVNCDACGLQLDRIDEAHDCVEGGE